METDAKNLSAARQISDERRTPRTDQNRGRIVDKNDVHAGVWKDAVGIGTWPAGDGLRPEAQQVFSERRGNWILVVFGAAGAFGGERIHGQETR